jgi:type IV pilus assembly protein PilW
LLVGLAVGLMVVAGAAMVSSTQLSDSRRLLLETQLQQDLRAAADIITRELRRAGSNAAQNQAKAYVWNPATNTSPVVNLYTTVTLTGTPATQVDYAYYRTGAVSGGQGPFGFKLENGVIKSLIDSGTQWQDLTDTRVVTVDTFTITENTAVPAFQLPCPNDCPAGGGTACWPTLKVRELVLDIAAHATGDTSIMRTLRTTVRLRNDLVTFSGVAAVCPP